MKKEIDNVVYESVPAIEMFADPIYKKNVQYCAGCAGQFDIPLCAKLRNCFEEKIIWKKQEC